MKKLTALLAAAAMCSAALCAENPQGDPASSVGPDGVANRGTYSFAKHDDVLSRLNLTEEQCKKIDAIYAEYQAKLTEAAKEFMTEKKLPSGAVMKQFNQGSWPQYRAKQQEIWAERDVKVAEVLTEEQKKKYDTARKIVEEYDITIKSINDEMQTVRQHLGGDRAKMQEAYKSIGEKRQKAYAERQKEMDEKIGKRPAIRGDSNGNVNAAGQQGLAR